MNESEGSEGKNAVVESFLFPGFAPLYPPVPWTPERS